MNKILNAKPVYLLWLVLTPFYFLFSHDLALFSHEYSHAFVASVFGYKQHFWQIHYGDSSLLNLLFFQQVTEGVNYSAIEAAHKEWLIALIAQAGILGNVLGYLISLWLMAKKSIQARGWLFYFLFWFQVQCIGNFIDYIPSRTFAMHGDVHTFTQALGISPWWVLFTVGYLVLFVFWYFYAYTLVSAYKRLHLSDYTSQVVLLLLVTLTLFGLYGKTGLHGYGDTAHFVSVLSVWLVLPVVFFCFPCRQWVVSRLAR